MSASFRFLAVVMLFPFMGLRPASAAEQGQDWARYVVAAPDVVYPEVIKRTGTQGTGTFVLTINPKTGVVDEVKVVRSTGYKLLNAIYVMNFFQWRFQPGTVKSVTITRGVGILGWARGYHTGRY